MSFPKNTLLALALAACAAASPVELTARDSSQVQTVSQTVPNQNVNDLKSVGNISPDTKAFLDKYQPDSIAASLKASSANLTAYPASGLCSKEYPCFTVDKVATTSIGSDSFDVTKAGALLDKILAEPELTFAGPSSWQPLPTLKIASDDLTFEAIGVEDKVESKILAGAVLDLFKAQGLGSGSNAIRGLSASDNPATVPLIALCVYPNGADATNVAGFCQAKEATSPSRRDEDTLAARSVADSLPWCKNSWLKVINVWCYI